MTQWLQQLDQILRGDATRMSSLRAGQIDIPIGGLSLLTVLLGAIYGACMGSFGILHPEGNGGIQILASALKLPLLFFLTLVVTFPSLYVFNALVGSRLSMVSVLRLLVAMLAVMLAVLASLGPIVVFFSLSTISYSFMTLLNVVVCGTAGFLGLAFLLRTLHRLVLVQEVLVGADTGSTTPQEAVAKPQSPPVELDEDDIAPPPEPVETGGEAHGALDRVGDRTHERARTVFQIWVVVFALVGAQMSWVLRPFLGDPTLPFQWFRPREGNFFEAVIHSIGSLLM